MKLNFLSNTPTHALFSINMDVNLLNNVNLDETPLPASSYNELPHIDDMKDTASRHAKAHAQLLGLIASHGLAQQFSIHLIHKHFNIPEGRVMVYETVRGPNHRTSSSAVPETR